MKVIQQTVFQLILHLFNKYSLIQLYFTCLVRIYYDIIPVLTRYKSPENSFLFLKLFYVLTIAWGNFDC